MKGKGLLTLLSNICLILMLMALLFIAACAGPAVAAPLAPGEKPAEVIPLEMLPAETPEVIALRKAIEAEVDALSTRMFEMNDWMYYNPESGYMEFEATKMTAAELEKHEFVVKFGVEGLPEGYNALIEARFNAGGLPTAYVAKYKGKSEHPVICFVTEHDALRGTPTPFQGCKHNMQAPVALGAAIALSKVMEENNLPGSVWVVATPAEEIPPPDKSAMARAGVFDEVDFVFKSHGVGTTVSQSKAGVSNCCRLINATLYDFIGKAVSSNTPGTPGWEGDALDAARIFLDMVDALRAHTDPKFTLQGTVSDIPQAVNVVQDFARVDYWIRNPDRAGQKDLDALHERIDTVARAAAMGTFCKVNIQHYADYYNGVSSAWGNALAWSYIKFYGDAEAILDEIGEISSSFDEAGYAGLNTPGLRIEAAQVGVPETAGHSHEAADQTTTPEAHEALVKMAKMGAAAALRLVVDPELLAKITAEHKEWIAYALAEGLITEDMIRDKWRK